MPPTKKDKYDTTRKTPPPKHKAPIIRRSSTHSPASSSSPPVLRRSSDSCSTLSPKPATVKSVISKSPPRQRPEWVAPPGKHCSPTYIPVPTFASSARKSCSPSSLKETGKNGKDGGVTPPAPAYLKTPRSGSTPKTPSPLLRQISVDGGDTPIASSGLPRRKSSLTAHASQTFVVETNVSSPKGLGLSFKDPFCSTSRAGSCVSGLISPILENVDTGVSISTPSTTSAPITETQQEQDANDDDPEKRDSLSPLPSPSTTTSILATSILATSILATSTLNPLPSESVPSIPHHLPSPLPSPSHLHPYTGHTHILPSCTAHSLTHRLACSHSILTPHPEPCAANCETPTVDFGIAKLKAQGFLGGVRGLDEWWVCPVCEEGKDKGEAKGMGETKGTGEAEGRGKGKKCVAVLDKGLLEFEKRRERAFVTHRTRERTREKKV